MRQASQRLNADGGGWIGWWLRSHFSSKSFLLCDLRPSTRSIMTASVSGRPAQRTQGLAEWQTLCLFSSTGESKPGDLDRSSAHSLFSAASCPLHSLDGLHIYFTVLSSLTCGSLFSPLQSMKSSSKAGNLSFASCISGHLGTDIWALHLTCLIMTPNPGLWDLALTLDITWSHYLIFCVKLRPQNEMWLPKYHSASESLDQPETPDRPRC